ncbi:Sip1-like protein, partial [Apiospora saccharicola]
QHDSDGRGYPILPPLGQVFKSTAPVTLFVLILHIDAALAREAWQVRLRHAAIASENWQEETMSSTSLLSRKSCTTILDLDGTLRASPRHVAVRRPLLVPVPPRDWGPLGDPRRHDGSPFISLVLPPPLPLPGSSRVGPPKGLADYLPDLNPALASRALLRSKNADGPGPAVASWMVEVPVEPARGDVPHMEQFMFGTPFGGAFVRWFGLARDTVSWMAPRQGGSYFKLDVAAMLCSFLGASGKHLLFLGISGFEDILTIFGDNNQGAMMIKVRNDRPAPGYGRVIVSVGDDWESTLAATLQLARGLVAGPNEFNPRGDLQRGNSTYSHWMDGLLYSPKLLIGPSDLEDQIATSLDKLESRGIRVSGLVLDDVWQHVDEDQPSRFQAGLVDFEASPRAFKKGLRNSIREIKRRHPAVRNVIVSLPILGHWGGLSEQAEGRLRHIYQTIHVERHEKSNPQAPSLVGIDIVSPHDDIQQFFNDYYAFLAACEVDAVLVDGVSMLESMASAAVRCSVSEAYLDAQSTAIRTHFPRGNLSSMSMSPCALFHDLKSTRSLQPATVRNSRAFLDRRRHVFVNSINSLISGGVGNIPDWGPVERTAAAAHGAFHVAARCISGGPIQISDFDGSGPDDSDLVRQISGMTALGETVVFRPSGIGKTTNPYSQFDDEHLLKIGNTHSLGASRASTLGLFNISERPVMELVSLRDFPGIDESTNYVVLSSTGVRSSCINLTTLSLFSAGLEPGQYEILTTYPLKRFAAARGGGHVDIAVLGLQGKMLGAATVIDTDSTTRDGVIWIEVVLKALGTLEYVLTQAFIEIYLSYTPEEQYEIIVKNLTVQGRVLAPMSVNVSGTIMRLNLEAIWGDHDWKTETHEIY